MEAVQKCAPQCLLFIPPVLTPLRENKSRLSRHPPPLTHTHPPRGQQKKNKTREKGRGVQRRRGKNGEGWREKGRAGLDGVDVCSGEFHPDEREKVQQKDEELR